MYTMPYRTWLLTLLAGIVFNHVITIPTLAQESNAEPKAVFEQIFAEWKQMLDQLRKLRVKAETIDDTELPKLQAEYDEVIAKGDSIIPKLRDAAIAVYQAAPNEDHEVSRWLSTIANDYVTADRYEDALPAINALIAGDSPDPTIHAIAGMTSFALNDFSAAKKHFERARAAGVLSNVGLQMMAEVDNYLGYWATEHAIRDKEAALPPAQQLPVVKLTTTKGDMTLELFEDQAPETVGNFVSLVEKGFYNGLAFHRVLPAFMAQGGCPEGNGTGGPGYNIYCESTRSDYRKHFRGSLSMALANTGRDTGGSQFFLTFLPTPQLNGKHTVFGRVIEGLDVLAKIQRRDPEKSADLAIIPDKILTAEVVRKRDHKYVPRKVN